MSQTPRRASTVTVRTLGPGDLELYHRVDSAAFGGPPEPSQLESKRPLIELDRWYLAEVDGSPCGGAGSFPTELTVPGGATLPVGAVSDVGVLPTHRRRGVLTALMRRQLEDLRSSGAALAVLHASEAAIYRRFGYGIATRWRHLTVESRRSAFRDDWPDPGGQSFLVPRSEAGPVCAAVHDRVRRVRPGGLARSDAWWQVVMGDAVSYIGGGPRRMVLVHHAESGQAESGQADGYAIYEVAEDWSSGRAEHVLTVWELVGETPGVELALWRVLFDHDLVHHVDTPIATDHVLWTVLADPRQARTVLDQDLLWARLLDVPRALESRTYGGPDATLVLDVRDPLFDDASGAYLLATAGGAGECTRTDAPPDLVLGVSELSSCVLGGNSFRRLVRAGQVEERTPGAAATADEWFGIDPLPWCWVRF